MPGGGVDADVAAVVTVRAGHQRHPGLSERPDRTGGRAPPLLVHLQLCAGDMGLPREVADGLIRDAGLGQPHLGQDAEQVRELWPPGHLQGVGRRLDQALDHLRLGYLTARDRAAHLAGVDRPEVRGKLMISDQDEICPGGAGRQVQPPGPVQDLGFHPGQHVESGHGPHRVHGGQELRHPRRAPADVVSQADRTQPALPRGGHVFGHGAHRVVGEGGVNVIVLIQPYGDAHAASFWTSLNSMKRSSR